MSLSRGASQKSGGGGLGSRKGSALSLKDMVTTSAITIIIIFINIFIVVIMVITKLFVCYRPQKHYHEYTMNIILPNIY